MHDLPGGYFQIRRSGGFDPTSSLEAKFRAKSGQVHQMRGKTWEVLSPQDAKVGKSPNFRVISEFHRAKFGVFVTYIFGGKIWAPTRISEANFGAKPPDLLIWKYPPGYDLMTTFAKFSKHWLKLTRYSTFKISSFMFCQNLIENLYMPVAIYLLTRNLS